ncbi:MAG: hypothetical protein IJN63_04570 [Clostridia bacterium]|nr:hypothetical protein [Clostridia bacterium]
MSYAYYEYIEDRGDRLFTVVLLPEREGGFPTVVCRSPYVKNTVDQDENDVVRACENTYAPWLLRGYAVVFQHCRGQGKSTGAFVPYVHEREDGLLLRRWIRGRSFYNGELFLLGASYTASLHYATAPFEADVKGAVFEVQDTERYRLWYRNAQMRKGHANWHFGLYKSKCGLNKSFGMSSFSELPLDGLSERVLGDRACDFEEMLRAGDPEHPFWGTRNGGAEAKNAVKNAGIPILLTTGYNDFYCGGLFRMWEEMDGEAKKRCALLVSPYNHGDGYSVDRGIAFEKGKRVENFGASYRIDWFDNIRFGTPLPFEKGVISYYRTFENGWQTDFHAVPTRELELPLGKGVGTFCYDPAHPTAFCGEGTFADEFNPEGSVITLYTVPFAHDVFVKGRMRARLAVESDRPDTTFYMRVSIEKPGGDYVLRHDITSLSHQLGDYEENSRVELEMCFDEYAFLLRSGERLRVDIAGTDDNIYVCHTNRRGEYYLQDGTDIALNTVYLCDLVLILPVE